VMFTYEDEGILYQEILQVSVQCHVLQDNTSQLADDLQRGSH